MTIRVTITKPGVVNEYGQALAIGTVYTPNNDDYALALIAQLKATDTDDVLGERINAPFDEVVYPIFPDDFSPVGLSVDGTSLVSGDGTNFYIGPTSDYEYPPTLVEITASQGVVGKSCGLLSVKCVAGSAIALTVYDNATTAAGTVLFSQTMSAGNAAVFPAPVQAINGVWAAFSGTATFEIEVQDVI